MIENISQLINSKNYPPVILMFGAEDFLLEEAYSKLIAELCPDDNSRFDLEILDAEEADFKKIALSCSSYPFVSKRRVVVVNRFDKLVSGRGTKKNLEKNPLWKYLASPQPTSILILKADEESLKDLSASLKNPKKKTSAEKTIKSAKFPYNIILEKYEWIEFRRVYESEFTDWVINRVKSLGKTIDLKSAELLISQSNPTLRDISNEINKLIIYIQEKKIITIDDVNFVVGASRVYNVFELQKAVGKRNLPKAIEILKNMLSVERQEIRIISTLTTYFIALFKLIEEAPKTNNNFQLASSLKINPYFVQEYLDTLRLYTPLEIENALKNLCEADELLKSSSIDSLYLLEKILINILEKKRK